MNNEFRHIGKETNRLLGKQIVTGRAQFTGDFKLPGMQYGKILRSPHPHAKIKHIDVEEAKKLPGVTTVLTYKDIDRNIYITNGYTPPKHHHLMDETVRFIGDAVALIVATSEDVAEEAMELIKVEYEILKPVFTIDEALAPDAPQLYPEFPRNIAPHKQNLNFEIGDIEKDFEESEIVVEVNSSLESGQNPLPVEAPIVIANWEGDTVTFIASAAAPAYCHQNVASSLDIPYECVRIIAPAVGGSFGSKLYSGNVHVLVFAAVMSKAAHCPVYFSYTKEEQFAVHQTRMKTQSYVKLGLTKDGVANAIEMRQYADAGAYGYL